MTGDPFEIIGYFFTGALIVSILADIVLTSTWNKTYFTSGLRIFIKRIPVNHWHTIIPNQSLFEEKFQSNWVGSLTFKEIDMISYGFREKIFQITWIRSTSIMHGLLIFDSNNNQIIVKGFANWSILVFSLIWLSVPISWLVRICQANAC